jgi:hypothetical protein
MVYFICGFAYNLLANRKKGLDAIPHYKLFSMCAGRCVSRKEDANKYEAIE